METRPIPAQLRYYAELRHGDAGRTWLAELDGRIERLAADFGLEVDPPFDPGGSEAWTAPVRRADGSDAVLKVPISAQAGRSEADALVRWAGRRAVRLLELTSDGRALLLERCRPGRRLAEEDFGAQDRATADIFRNLHVQVSVGDRRFPDLAEVLAGWAEHTRRRYRELGEPCRAGLVDDATSIMDHVHRAALLLHGDLHPENVLSAQREGWLAIDPIPTVGPLAFDAVQYLLFRGGELKDRALEWPGHIVGFCRLTGIDPEEVRELAFAKLIHDGLWALELGEPNWVEHLEVAERLIKLKLSLGEAQPSEPTTPRSPGTTQRKSVTGGPAHELPVPAAVRALAGSRRLTPVWNTSRGGMTFELTGDGTERVFVKWVPGGSALDLQREATRLRWAVRYTTVPEVLDEGSDEEGAWMVTAALPGTNAVTQRWKAEPELAVRAIGEGLRALHEVLPVQDCPFSWSAEDRLADARRRVADCSFNFAYWRESDHGHLSVGEALARASDIPPLDHLVVCHGDACSPNTLVTDDGRFSGHVDLGNLGLADRWADLSIATWATEWNYGPGWEEVLLSAYGVEPDPDRTTYYRLLWDLDP